MRTVTSSSFIPGTAAATRWRIACPVERSSPPSVRMTTDAEEGLALAAERAFVGEHDMHPRRLDRPHHLDRAREFAFERPQTRVTSCMNDVRPIRRLGASPKFRSIPTNISDRSPVMDSILNNSAALSALQALQMTQQSLNTVQNEVSTGLSVSSAADNSSYWSIAAQLNADSGVVQASNDALSQGQSILATASSAINSVITTINSIQTALTQATNPGADLGNINTSLASLGQQLDRRRQRRFVQRHERPRTAA